MARLDESEDKGLKVSEELGILDEVALEELERRDPSGDRNGAAPPAEGEEKQKEDEPITLKLRRRGALP